MDVWLASCRRLPEPDPDAAPLAAALAGAGVRTEVAAWDDPDVDWSHARLTVLRSTWNYPEHAEAFLAWLARVASCSELWNPLSVVRWNVHKGYLLDLERRGVPVTPTLLIRRGERRTLEQVRAERGWNDVVIKPAVSAASFLTLRAGPDEAEAGQRHLDALLAERDALIQPYLTSVEDHGERALVWIDGELTHAVRKTPRFSGEDEAVSDAVPIGPAEAALARRAVAVIPGGPPFYARVDVAPAATGDPVIMELELIEPSLFFPRHPPALARFVAGILRRLGRP